MGQAKTRAARYWPYLYHLMEGKHSGRHLAAIMFTDIVGYTAMMQKDETIALNCVRRHQQVLESQVPLHEGDIYQYYGDGSMSIFSSAIQAVHCAMEIQRTLQTLPIVPLRIGIHIGEIYKEDGKIFGDGVNIASRIESIGQAGTVLFSKDVFEKIRNHNAFDIAPLGKYEFKNVEEPVSVYALTNRGICVVNKSNVEGKLKTKSSGKRVSASIITGSIILLLSAGYMLGLRPHTNTAEMVSESNTSIAVLPFKNLTDAGDEEYLGMGIAEDLMTQLAGIRSLRVISRSSTMRYRDVEKSLKKIADELNVTTILEGSIRRFGENVRVSVQLIQASDERLIWAGDFDREITDILDVQKDIALEVSRELKINISPELIKRWDRKNNVNPEAYILYQKGRELLLRTSGSLADNEKARAYFEQAITLDSNFQAAWLGLADSWIEAIFWHRVDEEKVIHEAREAAMHALALDPGHGETYGVLGSIQTFERNLGEAEKNLKKSIELNPSYVFAYERLAWIAIFKGDYAESQQLYEKVIRIDPLSTRIKGAYGSSFYLMGKFQEGIDKMTTYLMADPQDNFMLWSLAYCQAAVGEYQKAIDNLSHRSIGQHTNWVYAYCYARSGQLEKANEILQYHIERSKRDHVPDFMMAVMYASVGEKKKAMEHLRISVESEAEHWFLLGMKNDPMLKSLQEEPGFHELLEKSRTYYSM